MLSRELSSTNHFHDHLSIIGSMCTSTSVYMFAWISILFRFKWNRFQTIITKASYHFFFLVLHNLFFFAKFIMVCIFEIFIFLKELHIILFWCMERFELYDGDDVCMEIYELQYCKCTLWLHNTIVLLQ